MVDALRRSPETHWNAAGIDALRTEMPRAAMERRQREALEARAKEDQKAHPSSAAPSTTPSRN